MKITKTDQTGVAGRMAGVAPASGVTVIDTGGYFSADDLEDILQEIGAGSAPGSFLRTTLGGVGNIQALGTLGATETIDLANANYFWGTLDQDCDITTVGWTNLKDCQITVEIIGDGTSTPTFIGWTWIGSAPGIIGSGDVLHAVGLSRDGGTTIYGAVVGGGSSSALHYEILMAGGISSPPEPLETGDGTDWLYVLVP
jgi:hypothetical protein